MPTYPYSLTITNPGAETGDTTGWTNVTGTLQATTSQGGTSPRTGTYFFFAGTGSSTEAYQDVSVPSDAHTDVDNGILWANFAGYHAGFSDSDQGALALEFYDSGPSLLGERYVLPFETSGVDEWRERHTGPVTVPPNTRTIRILQLGNRVSGTNLDSYWDDFTLELVDVNDLLLRVTNTLIEVWADWAPELRVTNTLLEVWADWNPQLRVTNTLIEVWADWAPQLRVTNTLIEVWADWAPELRITQYHLEVALGRKRKPQIVFEPDPPRICPNLCCPDCTCCGGNNTASTVAYVRLVNLFGSTETCTTPCADLGNVCFPLQWKEGCRWEFLSGSAPSDDDCYPDGEMILELSCDENAVTMTLTWTLDTGDVATFTKSIAGTDIDCAACTVHTLTTTDSTACTDEFSWAEVSYGRFAPCCTTCPPRYQITINGFDQADPEARCTDTDCEQINGAYVATFFQSGTDPGASCGPIKGDWCEYRSDAIAFRCTDPDYGVCQLRLFIRARDDCHLDVAVTLVTDITDDEQECIGAIEQQGWAQTNVAQNCRTLDLTMISPDNACLDTNWNCDNTATIGNPTIRVTAL